MATKSKLEQAVEKKAESLNEAQRELIMSQLAIYRQNNSRLAEIKNQQATVEARQTVKLDEVRAKQAQRAALSYEYNQLATANSRIAADLFDFLEG